MKNVVLILIISLLGKNITAQNKQPIIGIVSEPINKFANNKLKMKYDTYQKGDKVVFATIEKKASSICNEGIVVYISTKDLAKIKFPDSIQNPNELIGTYKIELEYTCSYLSEQRKKEKMEMEMERLEAERKEKEEQKIAEEKRLKAEKEEMEKLIALNLEKERKQEILDSMKVIYDSLLETKMNEIRKVGLWVSDWNWSYANKFSSNPEIIVTVENFSKKTIKYVTFFFQAYNPVEDIVLNIRGEKFSKAIGIGPLEPEESGTYTFDTNFYSKVISTISIIKIQVEYMDGSYRTYSGEQLDMALFSLE